MTGVVADVFAVDDVMDVDVEVVGPDVAVVDVVVDVVVVADSAGGAKNARFWS